MVALSPPDRLMAGPAALLSPALPALFLLCRVHPLDSEAGMTLTGAQLNGLRAGTTALADLVGLCPVPTPPAS